MDKQARKLTATRDEAASEGGSEGGGSNEDSDADEKVGNANHNSQSRPSLLINHNNDVPGR